MPLTRYQIRNEFNLADPDLYRASDKDDPEALLEGVAMAGLVGVLRQLGDLAEFAAEIFHDLHEEVMATSARGHGLMARIQQLEADVPSIENNLLSQTNHTAFYYNTGVDCHPQMCTDQNLITQGDMPRFIRDSYEECRGPPQLFLLDKFDIGGAGACLKRYSDPSFFKAEPTPSDAAKLETQRDRRTRKIKKKGSHWRNGDTPEVLTTSHAKLHQLLLEERIGNDSKVPARLVKLKKRILDDSKCSKSYMEKFLQTMSPEHSEIHEIEVGQPTLRLTYNYIDDSEREILDIQPVSTAKDSPYVSPTNQETKLRPSVMYSYDFNKSRRSKGSTVSVEDGNTIGIASPLHIPVTEKELGVDGENRHGNGIISSYSDDIASETESYLDALANMESEAETDNEYISKKELDMDSHSHLIPPADDHVGNNHAIVLKDVIARSASGEILNGFKHSVDSAPETYGSFLVKTDAAPFFEVNADDDDSLYTIKRELAETRDSEGHVSSFQRVLVDDVAVESNFGCKNDYDLAILPASSYSPSRNRNSSQISISSSDDLHHGGVQSEGLSSPRYLVNAELRSELNDLEDFKRGLAVRFEQSDQGTKPLDAIVSYSVDNQATHRLHTDSSTNSTSLRGKDHNPELANHLPSHFDASSFTPSSEELLFCQEEAVLKMPEPHCGQFPTSAVDFSTQDNSMKLDSDEEVIFQPDSIAQKFGDPQTEREVNLEGAPALPPLPPMQWRVGKPQDLFFDSEGESEEFTVASKGSLSPIALGLKGSLHFTPLNGESKQPFTATQTEESSPHIPRDSPGGFPLPTDSMLQVKDTIDVHGQHSLLTSEKIQTDSAVNYLLESGQPDTLAFIGETPKPSSGSYLPTSSPDTDSFTMEAIQPGYTSQYSLGDMNTHTKDTIQPKPAEHTLSMGETTQLCATLESPQPPLGDTVVSISSASEVPMHSTDQSLEELNSYSRTEHETQNDEKKIIKCLEVPGPHIKNEEHPKPEMKSLEREATWSLNETQHDEKKIIKCLQVAGPHIKNEEHPKPETKSLEREAKWSLALLNYEEEKLAERPAVKPPRPRNPLIESIDALDRSKLKKVTARTRRETPTVDDRGSLLEQIRTKSFNLKPAPAPVAKPIIQAPSMNLKVAAILEKANKIRRATAGSDEDEDEWSDD